MLAIAYVSLLGTLVVPEIFGQGGFVAEHGRSVLQQELHLIGVSDQATDNLTTAANNWLTAAGQFRPSLAPGAPFPSELSSARAGFETAWFEAGGSARKLADRANLLRALALLTRSYRFQEDTNPERPASLRWAEEMIAFTREIGDRRALTEALLEKGAIYLELSQLNHTDPSRFERISQEGDKLLQDTYSIALDEQKPEVLRYWSRFYYNLSRPRSGRLSERWDQRFLLLADQKIDAALTIEPKLMRNLNQKARVTQRRARATIDAPSQSWSDRLWNIHRQLSAAWKETDHLLSRPDERISPMNVLATLTLDTVTYQLAVLDDTGRKTEAPRLIAVLDEEGVGIQTQAWALVRNSNLSRAYGFDTVFDLARLYSLRGVLSGLAANGRQNEDIDAAIDALKGARELATVRQLDAAQENLAGDPAFSWLPEYARRQLEEALKRP